MLVHVGPFCLRKSDPLFLFSLHGFNFAMDLCLISFLVVGLFSVVVGCNKETLWVTLFFSFPPASYQQDCCYSLTLNGWFLNDGFLCGSPADLDSALSNIESEGPLMCLYLKLSKSLLFVPDSLPHPSALPDNILVSSTGFVLQLVPHLFFSL